MPTIMKNNTPEILKKKNLSISKFHRLLIRGDDTSMSYPLAHELATKDTIRETMEIGIIKRAAVALGVTFDDLVEIEAA